MKHILFFLFISTGLLAQTPRLNLKQLAKDTTFGSVLISTPSDSGIVFSRDFYISYGVDTVLILYGDTVGVGATLDAEQVQDIVGAMANAGLGIDITYNDTDGELLFESLSIEDSIKNETGTLIAKGTPLYATGVQGNYWTVAPADASDPTKLPVVVIAGENIADGATGLGLIKGHIKGVNTGDFTAGDEIWLASGGGYTNIEPKGGGVYSQSLGTVIKVDATDGSGIINIQEPHQTLAPDHIFIGGADSLITSTEYIVDSTRINTTGDTAYYYQNGVLIGTGAIAGGGTTYNNISETVDTVYISDYLDVDTSTLYVDAINNKVGIGTSSPISNFSVVKDGDASSMDIITYRNASGQSAASFRFARGTEASPLIVQNGDLLTELAFLPYKGNGWAHTASITASVNGTVTSSPVSIPTDINFRTDAAGASYLSGKERLTIKSNGNVGIGTTSPQAPLSVVGNIHILDVDQTSFEDNTIYVYNDSDEGSKDGTTDAEFSFFVAKDSSGNTSDGPFFAMRGNDCSRNTNQKGAMLFQAGNIPSATGDQGMIRFISQSNVIKFNTGSSSTNRFQIDNSGNIGVEADADYFHTAYSDIRLKDNISTIDNGISVINKIRPVVYKWKDGYLPNFDNEFGFIAQELMEAIPEAVSITDNIIDIDGNKIHNLLNIKERFILPFTVKAIQEQQAIIESIQTELDAKSSIIESQATEIEQLKSQIQLILSEIEQIKNN